MNQQPKLRFGVIGIDHRHIYDQVTSLLEIGAECAGYWTHDGDVRTLKGFVERFRRSREWMTASACSTTRASS